MTALGQVLATLSVLAVGIVYGTDVFCAIVLRPALALVDDRTLVSTRGRVHGFGDRRLRVPGIVGIATAVAATTVAAATGCVRASIAGAIAVISLAVWLVIYVRILARRQPTHGRFSIDGTA